MNSKVNSVIKTTSDKCNNFLNSKWAFVVFLSAMGIFTLINIVLFATGQTGVNVPWFDGRYANGTDGIMYYDENAWFAWMELFFGNVGSLLTITGVILTIRFNRKYIYPQVVGEILIIIDSVLIGGVFTGVSYFFMILTALVSYSHWKEGHETETVKSKWTWWIVSSFLLVYTVIGLPISFIFIYKSGSDFRSFYALSDVIGSGIVVCSWFLALRKIKWGFIGFMATDIMYIIFFCSVGVWGAGLSYVVYLFIDSTSFLSWWNKI